METLAQMLEDYRNGERGLPSYDELASLAEQNMVGEIVAVEIPGVMNCFPVFDVKWVRDVPQEGTKLYAFKGPSC